jgi:hypothetical protein
LRGSNAFLLPALDTHGMHVTPDYETEDILAVFDNRRAAGTAVQRVRDFLDQPHRVVAVPLEPESYQLADRSLQEVVHGAVRAARVSVPLGVLTGLGLGAVAVPGVGLAALAGIGVAGAIGGFVVGGMTGAITHTRFDSDEAERLRVPPGSEYLLVVARASPAPAARETSRVIGLLVRAGAIAFLDSTAYYAAYPEPLPDAQ